MPAKAQDFTWRLKDGSHAISISLFSIFRALRVCFPCLFSLLPLVYSHVTISASLQEQCLVEHLQQQALHTSSGRFSQGF